MLRRMIRNDILGNKTVTLTIMLFITAASMLLSLGSMLFTGLFGSIDRLMSQAMTPHFMQMHSGDLQMERLEAFAGSDTRVEEFQVLRFLNLENSLIRIGEHSLAGNLQDNGFCVQSGKFDFLLDLDDRIVQPRPGEVYVPVCYLLDGTAREGEQLRIGDYSLVVAGFVRDSQMNSALASSKRFVVNAADFAGLESLGAVEYLIEFRLEDPSELNSFEAAYSAAGLPGQGPTLTWPLFRMISAVSDGIMITLLLMVCLLVIFIALLCIRFTLLAKMEEDIREIGVMKAVGMRSASIRRLYLWIYAVIAAAGCAAGFLLSLVFRGRLQESMRMNLGSGGNEILALLLGAAGVLLIFVFLLCYVNGVLRRINQISPAQVLRSGLDTEENGKTGKAKNGRMEKKTRKAGRMGEKTGKAGNFKRSGNNRKCKILWETGIKNNTGAVNSFMLTYGRWLPVNLLLAARDMAGRKRLYLTMLVVIAPACFLMLVPQKLYHTIASREFITYLGVGRCDLRLDIQGTGQAGERTQEIGSCMESDPAIADYAVFITKIFDFRSDGGEAGQLKIELGDHTVFPLQYAEGSVPVSDRELALSYLNARELEKGVGDQITLIVEGREQVFTVCGIYSDITNGGKTAKAAFTSDTADTAWGTVCAALNSPGMTDRVAADYEKNFGFAKVSGMEEYGRQTFGQTLRSVRLAAVAAYFTGVVIAFLVGLLFMRLLAARDRAPIAFMRAVGFTGRDISRQYLWRAALAAAPGAIVGTVLAVTLGESLAGAAVSSLGAASFHFTGKPFVSSLLPPLVLLFAVLAAAGWGTAGAGSGHISEAVKE